MPDQDTVVLAGAVPVSKPAPPSRRWRSPRWNRRDITAVLVTAAAYYAAARIGLLPALVRGQVTPFWPPTGIAVACLLLVGPRSWPGIAVASFAVNVPLGPTLPAVVGIVAGNTLAPLAAVLILHGLHVSTDLARLRDAVLFVMAGVSSTLISASCGTAMLRGFGGIGGGQVWTTWSVWWAGDAMGVLVVAPVILQGTRLRDSLRMAPARLAEAVVLLGLVGVVMAYYTDTASPAVLLICPLLVWSAVRFRQAGAALVALEVSIIASAAAAGERTAFAQGSVVRSMLVLQLFNASVALTGLLLAAVITQLDDSRHDLAIANLLLAHRVEQRSAELHRDRNRLAVLTDWQRITTQLHDAVLQRLFGIGTALQGAAATSQAPNKERLTRLVDELDTTINDLAVAIYQAEHDVTGTTFRDAVDHVVAAATTSLSVKPSLDITGDLERVALAQRPQLLAALHDCLSDIVDASQVRITLAITRSEISMSVVADHITAQRRVPGEGMQRMRARAHRLAGTCDWQTSDRKSNIQLRFSAP